MVNFTFQLQFKSLNLYDFFTPQKKFNEISGRIHYGMVVVLVLRRGFFQDAGCIGIIYEIDNSAESSDCRRKSFRGDDPEAGG